MHIFAYEPNVVV